MFDTAEPMRHFPFFAELASMKDEDAAWRSVSAGLVFLRLVDSWVDDGPAVLSSGDWGVRSVRSALADLSDGVPVKAILESALDALIGAHVGDLHLLAPRLMAYARSLDSDGKWHLAADVYETIICHAHPIEESDAAIQAHVRLSYCQRQLGDLDQAERIAIRAEQIATAAGDIVGTLTARVAEAKVSLARGNYPRAEKMLDDTIVAADRASLKQFKAHAMQERADVAHLRGEFEFAIRIGYDALENLVDDRARDRMLADIAGAFYQLGVKSAARDAYLLLSVTAQEQYVRWSSSINLMEIAADDGSQPLFERHRRELETANLPPVLQAQYLIHAGQGLSRFGDLEGAKRSLREAIDYAESFGFNRLVFDAEAQMKKLSGARIASIEADAPDSLIPIVRALRARQQAVLAGV